MTIYIQSAEEMEEPPTGEILTVAEVAAYLNVSLSSVRCWCREGSLPAFRLGNRWRIHRSAVERFIAVHQFHRMRKQEKEREKE